MANTPKKKQQGKKIQVKFKIARICLVKKEVFPPKEAAPISSGNYTYSFEIDTNVFTDKKVIQIIVVYKFQQYENVLIEMSVENDFLIDNFQDVVRDGELIDTTFFE